MFSWGTEPGTIKTKSRLFPPLRLINAKNLNFMQSAGCYGDTHCMWGVSFTVRHTSTNTYFDRIPPPLYKLRRQLSYMWPGRMTESVESREFKHFTALQEKQRDLSALSKPPTRDKLQSVMWLLHPAGKCGSLVNAVDLVLRFYLSWYSEQWTTLAVGQHCIIIAFNKNALKYTAGEHTHFKWTLETKHKAAV